MADKKNEVAVSREKAEEMLNELYRAGRDCWQMEDSQIAGQALMEAFDKLFGQTFRSQPYWAEHKPAVRLKVGR